MNKETRKMLLSLQDMIMNEFDMEFLGHELTGNLRKSIRPEITENGIAIEILAPRYSAKIWFEKGYQQFTGKGSYASEVDKRGSWFGNHEGYIEQCIDRAVKKWMAYYHIKARIKK